MQTRKGSRFAVLMRLDFDQLFLSLLIIVNNVDKVSHVGQSTERQINHLNEGQHNLCAFTSLHFYKQSKKTSSILCPRIQIYDLAGVYNFLHLSIFTAKFLIYNVQYGCMYGFPSEKK